MKTVIINGTVLSNGVRKQLNVYFEDGKITEISSRKPDNEQIIDAKGMYVAPGFIDIHCHGAANCDFMDATVSSVETACNYHTKHGTTTIFPTTCTQSLEQTERALEAISLAKPLANIGGVHMESFFFSPSQCGAQDKKYILNPEKKYYASLISKYGNIIKRWSYAPELPFAREFEKDINSAGIILSAGHTSAMYSDMLLALDNGCKLITHLYSCTSTITRVGGFRSLGVIESALLFDEIDVELINDGCHIPHELLRLVYKIKGENHICLVTDANSATGTNSTVSTIGGNPCIIEDGVAKLPDRSAFAGSIATADRLLKEAVCAGIELEKAVKMLTETPARVMKLDKKGSIILGFDADIVLLSQELDVKTVIINGRIVFQ